ncbi:protein involved in gliding motility GldC [Chitinophaga costaii]|uniref:Protein involved in gliding motility GldC n=1 Tax=Chitinophaga costaii TaxID=1335309 RepID=A0A1C4F532_9BACT|nr:gliding motility protein GldC [Chitinophaga costaii]PUZ21276.1 gliding motility protein GldC [Chitinophaga costaii]SCC51149.1 protein involved in gliding motility GldC [Chitinophaga costaii]
MAKSSTIQINVALDEQRVPEKIEWSASDSAQANKNKAKAMMIAFWDAKEKTALRIDLWTKDMMVDEMADFFFQTMMTMADTYKRATPYHDQAEDLRTFARDFFEKFNEKQKAEQAQEKK